VTSTPLPPNPLDASRRRIIENEVKPALVKAGVLPEHVDQAARLIDPAVKVALVDGNIEVRVHDDHGQETGESIDQAAARFAVANVHFCGGEATLADLDKSPAKKAAFIQKDGGAAYMKLVSAAASAKTAR
jgi:hypothetical protein